MSVSVEEQPAILHQTRGRVRVHLPGWTGQGKHALEAQVKRMPGILGAQANALTGNVLILFDPAVTDEQQILDSVKTLELNGADEVPEPSLSHVIREKHNSLVRARIPVRGLNRDPKLAERVITALHEHYPNVRATVNHLTERVLVEYSKHEVDLEDLIAEIMNVEMPALPEEDRPNHPLDLAPLVQSAARLIGSSIGLGVLAVRQLLHVEEPLPGAGAALHISAILGVIQGNSPFRYGLRRRFGKTVASLITSLPNIITLTIAESPLGLVLNGLESVRLLTEAYARRSAWRRHEERVRGAAHALPGATIRLGAGEHPPLAARVVEGNGTAIGLDGLPLPAVPDKIVPPGARLYGGPFVLQLEGDETFQAFTPEPRPAPATPTFLDRYLRVQGPLSLALAAFTALRTRSWNQVLSSLLLVNARAAMIGQESAELHASARLIRAGVTVVGTRKERSFRQPDVVLFDGVRLLTKRLEVHTVLPMTSVYEEANLLALAAGIASAAGSPWGGVFKAANSLPAIDGSFDGYAAHATVKGISYTLGPVQDWQELPEAARLRQNGSYVLALRRDRDQGKRPLGLFALQPQATTGIKELVELCRRQRVKLGIIAQGDQMTAQALAYRMHIPLVECHNAVEAIRAEQQRGARVAFVSDYAGASAAFLACDLAIGLTDERSHLAAPADLLAPDLPALVAILETAARRDRTTRDSVSFPQRGKRSCCTR